MNKKFVIKFLLILVIFIGLGFGCQGLTQTQQDLIKPVTLNFWTIYDDVGELKKLAAAYKKIRPYVTVNIRQVRYEEFDNLFTNALADDVSPDVVSMHIRWLGKYLNRLSPMPASVKTANIQVTGTYFVQTTVTEENNPMPTLTVLKDAFVATVYDDIVYNNQVWGLPLAADTMVIYYNKDLLDKANVPEAPKTWDEFMIAVKAGTLIDKDGNIVQSGVALGTGANIDNAFDILSLLMMQSGVKMNSGRYITFAGGMDGGNISNHPTIKALNFYTDFAHSDKENYCWNAKLGNALQNFASGKSVFYFGFAYDYQSIKQLAPQLNIEVMPMLQLDPAKPVNVASYWVQSVPKKAKHQNESWDFVRYITSASNVKRYTEALKRPSPFRSQIEAQKKDELLAPFANSILTAKNWYRGYDYDTAKAAFVKMIDRYNDLYENGSTNLMRDQADNIIYATRVIQQTM